MAHASPGGEPRYARGKAFSRCLSVASTPTWMQRRRGSRKVLADRATPVVEPEAGPSLPVPQWGGNAPAPQAAGAGNPVE